MNFTNYNSRTNNTNMADNQTNQEEKNNNLEWIHILKEINPSYNRKDDLIIKSKQIKDSKKTWEGRENQFEPRLLCKHDYIDKQPKIFRDNGLALLSVRNGEYLLTNDNGIFINLPNNDKDIKKIDTPNVSMLLTIGESETSMLDKLQYSGSLDEIIEEKILIGPLLGGRHRCNFNTIFNNKNITVQGSQYETDGCYETKNYYVVVEAKNIDGDIDNFNIRQLYFPSKTIYDNTNGCKKIISLYIYKNKKNDIINIYKYKWNDINVMNDIHCIDYYRYKFNNL